MSRETVLYGGHSCATLARGIAMANHGEHGDPTNALQAQIEARLAACLFIVSPTGVATSQLRRLWQR